MRTTCFILDPFPDIKAFPLTRNIETACGENGVEFWGVAFLGTPDWAVTWSYASSENNPGCGASSGGPRLEYPPNAASLRKTTVAVWRFDLY